MIRIGFSRWFIETGKTPMSHGQVKHYILLRPQARKFKIFASEWRGIHHSMVEKEVSATEVLIESIDDTYGLNPLKEMQLIKKLASEAASDAVYKCYSSGILSHRKADPNQYLYGNIDDDTGRAMAIFVVEAAIMRSVSTGIADEDEQDELCDLVQHMKELYEQQERERQERIRLQQEQAAQMRAQQVFDRQRYEEMEESATKTSFDLLMSILSDREKKELDDKGYITVKNNLGEFRVPVSKHGFVEQFVDDKHVQNHCIVFGDWMIPPGDEALMKIALLKTDPARFMKVSNKQPIYRRFGG